MSANPTYLRLGRTLRRFGIRITSLMSLQRFQADFLGLAEESPLKAAQLDNYHTLSKARVRANKNAGVDEFNAHKR
jgi:hypothetical protein